MSSKLTERLSRHRIRFEVERLPWPTIILSEETGDAGTETERLRESRNFWRTCALFILAAFVAYVLTVMGV